MWSIAFSPLLACDVFGSFVAQHFVLALKEDIDSPALDIRNDTDGDSKPETAEFRERNRTVSTTKADLGIICMF
jgi:hypothetical protein